MGGGRDTDTERRRRFASEPFAVLATHGPDDRLDLVPCCFAVVDHEQGPEVVSAVDHKPKRHQKLARLANIARNANVAVIVDHRDLDDWSALWWVRVQGRATVIDAGPARGHAIRALAEKYPQYQAVPPQGPVIRIRDLHWSGWVPEPFDQFAGRPGDDRAS